MPPKNQVPQTLDDLAIPPGTESKAEPAPADEQAKVANAAKRYGLSGETATIILAAGEGDAGKEAQFVRVNEHTWLVPRNVKATVPIEVYNVLADTLPPVQEGSQATYAPRFSVSMLGRFPAPAAAA